MFDSPVALSARALRFGVWRLAEPLALDPDGVVDGAVDDVEAIEQIAALLDGLLRKGSIEVWPRGRSR
ncbi:MAG TPA: hypothetical protein VFL94_05985 [Actinomycetales bacterium]|nr:hypothetical protein [Actinomycetales bacterium]